MDDTPHHLSHKTSATPPPLSRMADEERRLADRLAMLLVQSQACDAPLWWVMERADLLEEWTKRRGAQEEIRS